jgi:hypothetical protein
VTKHETVNELLRQLVKELLVIRCGQPCLKTANGIPMGMGVSKERRVTKLLRTLQESGVSFHDDKP